MKQLEQERTTHLETQNRVRQERGEKEEQIQARQYSERKADHFKQEVRRHQDAQEVRSPLDRERVLQDRREASKTVWDRFVPPK